LMEKLDKCTAKLLLFDGSKMTVANISRYQKGKVVHWSHHIPFGQSLQNLKTLDSNI